MLEMIVDHVKQIATLDIGVDVSIVSKATWEKWGKTDLKKTCMGLQLKNGKIK